MTSEFIIYDLIALAAWVIALLLIKPRNAIDFSRCVGWYMLVFLTTYAIRPSLSELTGDFWLYDWLRIGTFEEHWQLMATAVPLALFSFAIGYAAGRPGTHAPSSLRSKSEPKPNPRAVKGLVFVLLLIGYISTLFVIKHGSGVADLHYADANMGAYEHNTAWFAQDDLLISSATILYYILTGHLGTSLLLSAPWMAIRILNGGGRTNLIGHFFGLMAVYFLRQRSVTRAAKVKSRQVLTISAGVLVVLVLFPLMGMLRALKHELGINSLYSKDAFLMLRSSTDPDDLVQDYVGTSSPVAGFELTLAHLINDNRSELGTQYLYYYFVQPIPRVLWPGKGTPYAWPEKLRGIEVDPRIGLIGGAPGSIGMAYEQWGWLGIPFEFILTGLIIRKWEEAARRRPGALHIQLGYAGLYSMLPQLGRDSLFLMFANFWLFKFGIPVLVLWMMYKAARERARMPRAIGAFSGAAIVSGTMR